MPGRLEFDLSLRPQGKAAGAAPEPGRVRRLLLLGNFSGQAALDRTPLAQRRSQRVDLDNFDTVMARLAPRLKLNLGGDTHELAFGQLDDFDADALLLASEPLRRLQALCAQLQHPASFAQAAAQLMGTGATATGRPKQSLADLLGGQVAPPSPGPENPAPATVIDAFIAQIVGPLAQPAAPPQQASFVAATQAALVHSLRELLHQPEFQALEGLWRGVAWLLSTLELDETLELHLLDVTREELLLDVVAAGGQPTVMQLQRVLSTGAAVGAPHWTALLGLLAFDSGDQDLGLLAAMGRLAQAVGAPWVAGAGPDLVAALLPQASPSSAPPADLASWHVLRRSELAPWIGLAAPRLLMRLPYGRGGLSVAGLVFEETDSASAHDSYLWGPAALACAWALAQTQGSSTIDGLPGWSLRRNGEVEQLPCAERWLSESDWQALLQAGVMPLVSHAGRHAVQLPRLQSLAQPAQALSGI